MIATLSGAAPAVDSGQRFVADLERLASYYKTRGLTGENLNPAELSFAVGLARYRLAPPASKMLAERAHVIVFGGAGAGKSTVSNILIGADVAEVNAQAGYTRRPTAFYSGGESVPGDWPDRLGVLERTEPGRTAEFDADYYAVHPLDHAAGNAAFLDRHVVWDCPDLTTKDAAYYEFRAIEMGALADVGVYVASDERYNDELPTHFLQAMLDAGKPVVVALTKVSPVDAAELLRLFRDQVGAQLGNAENLTTVVVIPSPGRTRLERLWTPEFLYGDELRSAVDAASARLENLRRRGRLGAVKYLKERQGRLLDPLRKDLGEWQAWAEQVRQAANETVLRYEREYLARVEYPQFREATEQLSAAFRPPPPMDAAWRVLEALRWPARWMTGRTGWRPAGAGAPTADAALDRIRRGLLEQLQVAAAARKSRHRFWSELYSTLDREVRTVVEPAYKEIRDRQARAFGERMRRVAGAAAAVFDKRPALAGLLQYGRLFLEGGLLLWLLLALWTAGVSWIILLLVLPAAAGAFDAAVRWACDRYIAGFRAELVRRQRDDVREAIQVAYINPLLRLPHSAGPILRDLAGLADRFPVLLAEAAAVEKEASP